jgi:hypothetical protein
MGSLNQRCADAGIYNRLMQKRYRSGMIYAIMLLTVISTNMAKKM